MDKQQTQQSNIPVVMWRFCAYKTEKDYESGEHYFVKNFLDHTEMKVFSSEHSAKEKLLYPDYCSMYWKIETNRVGDKFSFKEFVDDISSICTTKLNIKNK